MANKKNEVHEEELRKETSCKEEGEAPKGDIPEELLNANKEDQEEPTNEEEEEPTSSEVELLKAQLLRLQADFENYRARTERQRGEMVAFANEKLISKLLGVLDNLERAMASGSPDDPIIQGIRLVYDEFLRILMAEGLEEIPEDGEFDPNLHHAVMMEEVDGIEPDHITETLQKGYRLKDRVIRAAMVKVAK